MSNDNRLIPAVGYLRKSDKKDGYETSLADQKARIKRLKPAQPGMRYEIIRWYVDPGVKGWKPAAKRPDYLRMVNDLRDKKDFTTVLVDDMDRFSRRDSMETVADVQALHELGVRYIHAVNQGLKDLSRDRTLVTMQIALEANASHEHCVRLSRRIVEERKKAAERGLRAGGNAPYGLENVREFVGDEKEGRWMMTGNLKHGDPKEIKTVRLIFDWFVNELRSLNWIAAELNRRGLPSPSGRGKAWYVKSLRKMLRCRAYRGDFTYNDNPTSRFYAIDAQGEVVLKRDVAGPEKRYLSEGVYEPLVDPAVFDRAQHRLDTLAHHRSRRKRSYALSGILICDHCGHTMHGCRQKRSSGNYSPVFYRCGRNAECGHGACGQWQIREDRILPFVVETAGEALGELIKPPPPSGRRREVEADEGLVMRQAERNELAAKIARAEENLLFVEDARTRKSLDAKVSEMRDRLEKLDAELESRPSDDGRSKDVEEILARLRQELESWMQIAVTVPLIADGWPKDFIIAADPIKVNEALHQLGCEVRLRWKSEGVTKRYQRKDKNGTLQSVTSSRHALVRGRFRLGQRQGELPRYVLESPASPRPSAARRHAAG